MGGCQDRNPKILVILIIKTNFIRITYPYIITRMLQKLLHNNKPLLYFFSTKRSPYQILGVKHTASLEQIKKAYRLLAQKYHPDKNPDKNAQTLFLETKQAYEMLADQDKRRQYDNENYGAGGKKKYGFEKDPFDQFKDDVYRDKSRVYHETYSTGSTRRKRGDDISQEITINFMDSVKGSKIKLEFERKDTCKSCGGNRCQAGTAPTRCLACGGSGTTIYRQQSIVMHLQCTRCNGIGIVIKHPCTDCKATGIKVSKVQENLDIPAGISNGQKLTFKQKVRNFQGNQSDTGPSGDLHIKVNVEKHPRFRRNQNNIQTTEWLTISQAALGTKKTIETIWNKKQITIVPGTQDGSKLKLRGQGIKKGLLQEGDHICTMRIKVPTNLTPKQREIFQLLAKEEKLMPQQNYTDNNESNKDGEGAFQKFKDFFK